MLLLVLLNCFTCWCATLLTFLLINVELIWKTEFADSVRCRFNSAFLLFSDMVLFLITAAKTLLNKKADVKVRTLSSLLPSPPFPHHDAPRHDFPDRNMTSCSSNGSSSPLAAPPFSCFHLVPSVMLNIIFMLELPSFSVSVQVCVLLHAFEHTCTCSLACHLSDLQPFTSFLHFKLAIV